MQDFSDICAFIDISKGKILDSYNPWNKWRKIDYVSNSEYYCHKTKTTTYETYMIVLWPYKVVDKWLKIAWQSLFPFLNKQITSFEAFQANPIAKTWICKALCENWLSSDIKYLATLFKLVKFSRDLDLAQLFVSKILRLISVDKYSILIELLLIFGWENLKGSLTCHLNVLESLNLVKV